MDAGIASDENIEWLKHNQYPYIVVSRRRHRQLDEDEAVVGKQDSGCTVKAQKVMDSKNDDIVHVRKSTRPEPRQQEIYSALGIRFHPGRADLNHHAKRWVRGAFVFQQVGVKIIPSESFYAWNGFDGHSSEMYVWLPDGRSGWPGTSARQRLPKP